MITALLLACMTLPSWATDQGELRQTRTSTLQPSSISMIQAISNIESASGTRVLNAEFDPFIKPPSLFRGPMVCGLLTNKDDTFMIYFVDIATGKVLRKRPDWFNAWRLRSVAKSAHLTQAKISLVQGIQLAESHTGGKAVQARTVLDGKNLFYQITMLVGDRPMRVNIDTATGRLTDIPID